MAKAVSKKYRGALAAIMESLEPRMLLSVVISADGKSGTYTDTDGDLVTITTTRGVFTEQNFKTVDSGIGEQLQEVSFGPEVDGGKISVTAEQAGEGDGLVAVGRIPVYGKLKSLTVDGDVGRFDVGGSIDELTVDTLGRYGIATQEPPIYEEPSALLESVFWGDVDSFQVNHDFVEGKIGGAMNSLYIGGSLFGAVDADSIGSVVINGDVNGESAAAKGTINVISLGSIYVGGSVIGGTADGSGGIGGTTCLKKFEIVGSIVGGAGSGSGWVGFTSMRGRFIVGGDVAGGAGEYSGAVSCETFFAGVSIGGSIIGWQPDDPYATFNRGFVSAFYDIRGPVAVGGDINGGKLDAGRFLAPVIVKGSVIGGNASGMGKIEGGVARSIYIGHDLVGGAGIYSGTISVSRVSRIVIGGSVIGGHEIFSGSIYGESIGLIWIGEDFRGGDYIYAGQISISAYLGSLNINGSLIGGSDYETAVVYTEAMGAPIRIAGDMVGGAGPKSAVIYGAPRGVWIGGSMIGGDGWDSAKITDAPYSEAHRPLGPIVIKHDMIGGNSETDPGVLTYASIMSLYKIASVKIGGSISTGTVDPANVDDTGEWFSVSTSIRSDTSIGLVKVAGDILGHPSAPVIISAGQRISTLQVGGKLEQGLILAGYSTEQTDTGTINMQPSFPNGSIGKVIVGEDMIATSIVAGVIDGGDDGFGDESDTLGGDAALSTIGLIKIGGTITGTEDPGDQFGIVAGKILKAIISSSPVDLTNGTSNDVLELDAQWEDVMLREV